MYLPTYIYIKKFLPTFLWVSKFHVKLGFVVKNLKITAGTGVPREKPQGGGVFFHLFSLVFIKASKKKKPTPLGIFVSFF